VTATDYVPTVGESGPFRGPFSSAAEWHALAVRVLVGVFAPDYARVLVAASLGDESVHSAHIQDATDELAYTAVGVTIGRVYRWVYDG